MRIDAALAWAIAELHEGESPTVDAKVLLSHVIDKPQVYLFTWPDKTLSVDEQSTFQLLVAKRAQGIPVAYLTGSRDFWTLSLLTSEHTLIPRPDTEVLVEQTLSCIAKADYGKDLSICDLGTGTGAIALALASEFPCSQVTGVDFLDEAVTLARKNALQNGIINAKFLQSSWFDGLTTMQFHVIVSNPPYIEESSPFLHQGDVQFEPLSALTSGSDGLTDIRHIIRQAPDFLHKGGMLALEHGFDQAESVKQLLQAQGFKNIIAAKDYGNHDRVTIGFWHA